MTWPSAWTAHLEDGPWTQRPGQALRVRCRLPAGSESSTQPGTAGRVCSVRSRMNTWKHTGLGAAGLFSAMRAWPSLLLPSTGPILFLPPEGSSCRVEEISTTESSPSSDQMSGHLVSTMESPLRARLCTKNQHHGELPRIDRMLWDPLLGTTEGPSWTRELCQHHGEPPLGHT